MDFSRRIAQLLHEEHRATITTLEALENMIAKAKRSAPDASDPQVKKVLGQVGHVIGNDVNSHFGFEENQLFTRLAEFGDVAIGEHLSDEHRAMRPLGEELSLIAGKASGEGFDDAGWEQFKALSGELIERMMTHIQKEEMALLPMLEELIDSETDMELTQIYSQDH